MPLARRSPSGHPPSCPHPLPEAPPSRARRPRGLERGHPRYVCAAKRLLCGVCALVPVWCLPEVADSSASNHHTPCLRFQVVAQCDPVGDAVVLAEVEPRVIADTRRKLPIFELAHPFE